MPADFFVSYTQADRAWAEWIAWTLEDEGYRVLVQAWDFVPGTNWIQSMQAGVTGAERTIAVLSEASLVSVYGSAEWQAAWAADPLGRTRKLLPVRVQKCDRPGFLDGVVSVDVFTKDEPAARATLVKAVVAAIAGRAKPDSKPSFPGRAMPRRARFPGSLPTVWKVAARNPNFVGRDEALAALARALSSGSTVTVHSVQGLGGVGKTQLAIEYAHTHASSYDVIWTIAAEEAATIPDQFAALARKLGLPETTDPDDLRDQVHDALRHSSGWLLIFDNADSVEDIHPWLPTFPLPPGTPGHVLVTTRRHGFTTLGPVLDLDVIDLPAAVQLLHTRVPSLDQDVAEQLATQLGCLPLGLEQAAAYLARTATPVADYLRLLRTAPAAMLAEGVVPAHGDSLATVWNLSLDRLAAEAPAAMQLLDICAYLAPESIPIDLFNTHPAELPDPLATVVTDDLGFTTALATLVDYSLAKRAPTTLQLHRLLQSAIRLRHDDPSPAQSAVRLLHVDSPAEIFGVPDDWPRWEVLLPHVLVAVEHIGTGSAVSELMNRAGVYLMVHGHVAEARKLVERAVVVDEEVHGPEHPNVAAYLSNLAMILGDLGEYAAAGPLAERALTIVEAVHGPGHPEVATHLSNLATIQRDLGDLTAARQLTERALAIDEAVKGPDHLDLAKDLNNLAMILKELGEGTAALLLAERAVAIAEAVQGPCHPDVAVCLSNLATIQVELGDLAAARQLSERALTIDEAVYDPDHPNVARDLSNLATILSDLGEPASVARPLAERALAIAENIYGSEHPTTQLRRKNLAALSDE